MCVEELEVVVECAEECEERIYGKSFINWVDSIEVEMSNTVLVPESSKVRIKHKVTGQENT